MIRKFLLLLFFSILLAGCITDQPAESGTLQLTSSPTGAEIYLDNQYRGTTPSTISNVVPGSHTLEFRLKGYKSWKSAVTIPSGTSNYIGALTALSGSEQGTDINPAETAAAPPAVTVQVGRDQIIIGDSNRFSGTATGTSSVTLTLYGPGYYANGIVLDKVKPNTAGSWSYTWNPGTKIQSGTYTIIVHDANTIVSDRATFTAIGGGEVSVTTNSRSIGKGDTVVISGRCSTGAQSVRVILIGPDRFAGGVDLGSFTVSADKTWSLRYTTDLAMPTGIYSVYVSDVPQTTTGSSQFTLGYSS